MTRDRLRPALLARKVLLPPILTGVAVACLLAVLAATSPNGSRARAANPLGGGVAVSVRAVRSRIVVTALAADLEGRPAPRDIRRARKPLPERLRLLGRHPYYRLYVRAQRRHRVPWVLVASVHYQETGFERRGPQSAVVMRIARQLRAAHASRKSLGNAAMRAVTKRYGADPEGRVSTAMVVERARAWRLLGTLPKPGRGELATPVAGIVGGCGYFGCPRPGHLHNGVDFLAPYGVPVHAADAGRVALVQAPGASGGYGNFVCLQHRPHLATCYAHLGAVAVGLVEGARVRRGEVIGLVGSTGHSTAPHLHFEARLGPATCQSCAADPLPLLSGDVPQSRVPRMLRASANAASALGAGIAARGGPRSTATAADGEITPREPAPLIPAGPKAPATAPAPAPAPAPRAPFRRPPPAPATRESAAPTGGASVEATPPPRVAPVPPATPAPPAAPVAPVPAAPVPAAPPGRGAPTGGAVPP